MGVLAAISQHTTNSFPVHHHEQEAAVTHPRTNQTQRFLTSLIQ